MVLVQKWPFFHFFLGNIDKENVFYNILEKKNHPFKLEKHQVEKVDKLKYFQSG